ncbi:hypothetical protein V1478_007624 [Vespula squamosa]|uniref:Uncharacterized protein n=1 Tax=Vespula squamosa TaxID=30214 RepID=A0ABD2B3R2_VESSQ
MEGLDRLELIAPAYMQRRTRVQKDILQSSGVLYDLSGVLSESMFLRMYYLHAYDGIWRWKKIKEELGVSR